MPSATLVGAGLGLAAQLYCNALMKLPLMRSPWQHLIAMGAGAAFAAGVVQVEANAEKELAVLLKRREEANSHIKDAQ